MNHIVNGIVEKMKSRCPHSRKWQLVEWYVKYFNTSKRDGNSKTKKQLYAIWYRERDKNIYEREDRP